MTYELKSVMYCRKFEQNHGCRYPMDKRVIIFLLTAAVVYGTFLMHHVRRYRSSIFLGSSAIHEAKPSPSLFRIAIIGSSGYIGSRLLQHLNIEKDFTVIGYDRIFPKQASHQISTHDLHQFQTVIYLGGLTDRAMCQNRSIEIDQENINDIQILAKRMLSSQLLVFASTSAIAEGSGRNLFREDSSVQPHLLDSYVRSLWDRENSLRKLSVTFTSAPQIIGLRLGTVVGLSLSQRTDSIHIDLVCQAFLGGKLRVSHPESNHAFLCMEDLMQAVVTVIRGSRKAKRFEIFHLQSFSTTIANIANVIATKTGAHIQTSDHPVDADIPGFSLSTKKFTSTFQFIFQGDQEQIVSKLIEDVPRMCLGRQSRLDSNSIACVVCGSSIMHTILDLHSQPLGNDFRIHNSTECERFPLRLVRCSKCHHTQLSFIVDRKYILSHFRYQNESSESLILYFEWLVDKVIDESARKNGTVLEISCNDGSLLNKFSARRWKTFGVEAVNYLVELARAQNHTVFAGFWGVDVFPQLPSAESLDAIIVRNVLADTEKPVDFLRACIAQMSRKTKLYIQTSQCEMYETGQFDNIHHEHVSFFTAHSFQTIANLVGLRIVNLERISTHGRSCLLTLERKDVSNTSFITSLQNELVPSLSAALEKERKLGMTTSWFYMKYRAQAAMMRQWIVHQLTMLHNHGHTIVAYGALAEGMVLLHYFLEISDRAWNISYVVDDTPSKQNTYCPGTTIPIFPISKLSENSATTPLAIILFAWDSWNESSKKIRQETINKGINKVVIILPFPQQQLIKLDSNDNSTLTENFYKPLPWPFAFPTRQRQMVLLCHFFNEELLLPYWIRHHASMFDMAILIDYNSTDKSLEIIRQEAPRSWKIVSSRNGRFEANLVDDEVKDYESMHPDAWKIVLNVPEFLVHSNLRKMLAEMERTIGLVPLRFRSVFMSGNNSSPLKRFSSLLKQRSVYAYNPADADEQHAITIYSRFLHRQAFGPYRVGRHGLYTDNSIWAPTGFIAKYHYTPWPEIKQRKLQKGHYYPGKAEELEQLIEKVQRFPQVDLQDIAAISEELAMVHCVWKDLIDH